MQQLARVCQDAAKAGGEVLLKMRGKIEAREKGPADLVTEADIASQNAIFDVISKHFPDHELLGEESSDSQSGPDYSKPSWIVDPLDGTTNYVHGLENYSVSVALREANQIITGAIYDPVRGHCYHATHGSGAFLNDMPIRCSSVNKLSDSLVSASFSPRVPRNSPEIDRFLAVLDQCQALRRLGSAALNLCYVASGKLDAYWATSLKQWDVAAGVLIVREAGGCIAPIGQQEFDLEKPRFVATSQPDLRDEMLHLFASIGD